MIFFPIDKVFCIISYLMGLRHSFCTSTKSVWKRCFEITQLLCSPLGQVCAEVKGKLGKNLFLRKKKSPFCEKKSVLKGKKDRFSINHLWTVWNDEIFLGELTLLSEMFFLDFPVWWLSIFSFFFYLFSFIFFLINFSSSLLFFPFTFFSFLFFSSYFLVFFFIEFVDFFIVYFNSFSRCFYF